MRKDLKYFLSIVTIFSLSIYFLILLLKKYAALTFEHFLETCKVVASSFFSTGAHYVGFILTVIVLIVILGLFLKTLLSYIKTKRKLEVLLQKQIPSLHQKLKIIDVPIHYKARSYGKTNISRFKEVWFLLWMCVRAFWVLRVRR